MPIKHTPGPWRYDPYWSLIHGAGNVEVAAVHAAIQHGEKRARLDTARANARLIAAAPDLLEALRRAINHLIMDIDKGKGIHSTDTPDALRQARAAIAKATT